MHLHRGNDVRVVVLLTAYAELVDDVPERSHDCRILVK